MKSPQGAGGYTIIEVMIFLVISTAMLGSVMGALTLQNRKHQFTESVQTFNLKLQDLLNDVDTGYFPSNSDFSCTVNAATGVPTFNNVSGAVHGTNKDCVFAGKSISRDATNPSNYNVQTLVGRRSVVEGGVAREVKDVSEANITVLTGGTAIGSDSGVLSSDVQITKILSRIRGVVPFSGDYTTFGMLTGFGQSQGAGSTNLKSGNIKSSLGVLTNTGWNTAQASGGVLICLSEPGGNGRKAAIGIGGDFAQGSTQVIIDNVPGECL